MQAPTRRWEPSNAIRALTERCISGKRYSVLSGVQRLHISKLSLRTRLRGHTGCVNTISWDPSGTHLISGSDDTYILLFDLSGHVRQRIESGHALNIFAAECISPSLAGGTIVSCALDGRVIANQLDETCAPCGRRLLGRHAVRANRLSLFPGSPFEFVSVGSDGIVAAYDLRERQCRRVAAALSYSLNSVDVSPLFSNHVLLCGRSPLVTLHDLRGTHPGEPIAVFCPAGLAGGRPRSEEVTVTRAVWSVAADRIAATYNDELVYVFDARASVQSKSYLDWCQSQERRAAVFAVASPAFSGGGQQRQQRSASATLSSDDTEEDAPLLRDPAPSLTAPRARSVVSSQSRRSGADSSSCAASRSHSRSPASGSGGDPEAGPPDTPGFPPVYSSASSQHSQVDSSSESSAASMRDDSIDTGDDEAAVGWVGMEELTGTDSDDSAFGSDSNDGYSDDSDADSIPGHLNLGPAMNAEEAVDARIGIDLPFACDPSRSARYYGTGAVDPSAPLGSFGTWVQRFTGHRNCDTVKGVTFMGERSEFVVSGSDCGNIFFWDAASAEVVQMIRGDSRGAVNSLAPHPHHLPLFAASGLDNDAKLFDTADTCTFNPQAATSISRVNTRNRDAERSSMPILQRGTLRAMLQDEDASDDDGSERAQCTVQ